MVVFKKEKRKKSMLAWVPGAWWVSRQGTASQTQPRPHVACGGHSSTGRPHARSGKEDGEILNPSGPRVSERRAPAHALPEIPIPLSGSLALCHVMSVQDHCPDRGKKSVRWRGGGRSVATISSDRVSSAVVAVAITLTAA